VSNKFTDKVAARVAARHAAAIVCEMAVEEGGKFSTDAQTEFWKAILGVAMAALPEEHHPVRVVEKGRRAAMSNDEATVFEAEPMPFGKWANRLVAEVPLDYFDWLIGQDSFHAKAERYMRNPRVQREVAQAAGGESRE